MQTPWPSPAFSTKLCPFFVQNAHRLSDGSMRSKVSTCDVTALLYVIVLRAPRRSAHFSGRETRFFVRRKGSNSDRLVPY